jgi:hypothetical protein
MGYDIWGICLDILHIYIYSIHIIIVIVIIIILLLYYYYLLFNIIIVIIMYVCIYEVDLVSWMVKIFGMALERVRAF